MSLHPSTDTSYCLQGLFQVFFAVATNRVECSRHFGVYDEFADFVDTGCRSIFIIRSENPPFVSTATTPTSSQNRRLYTLPFYETLQYTYFSTASQNRWQNCLHFSRTDNFYVISCDSSITIFALNVKKFTFLSTATNSFSSAPSVILLVIV